MKIGSGFQVTMAPPAGMHVDIFLSFSVTSSAESRRQSQSYICSSPDAIGDLRCEESAASSPCLEQEEERMQLLFSSVFSTPSWLYYAFDFLSQHEEEKLTADSSQEYLFAKVSLCFSTSEDVVLFF